MTIHSGFVRIAKTFYFRQKAWPVAIDGQEMTGSAVNDDLGGAGLHAMGQMVTSTPVSALEAVKLANGDL